MLPTVFVCSALSCFGVSIERTEPSQIACEEAMPTAIAFVRRMSLPKDAFIHRLECVYDPRGNEGVI